MREIKFRGKRVDNNQWVYGYYFTTPLTIENFGAGQLGDGIKRHCISTDTGVVYAVAPETLGQFTGIFAKYLQEVYEGDIVRWGYTYDSQHLRIAIVKNNPDIQLYCLNLEVYKGKKKVFRWGAFAYSDIFDLDGEVLGNMYDNPELLEVKQ